MNATDPTDVERRAIDALTTGTAAALNRVQALGNEFAQTFPQGVPEDVQWPGSLALRVDLAADHLANAQRALAIALTHLTRNGADGPGVPHEYTPGHPDHPAGPDPDCATCGKSRRTCEATT